MNKYYLTPAEVAEATRDIGVKKVKNKPVNTLLLALMAGMYIAFAGAGSTMAGFNLLSNPDTYGLGRAIVGAFFATGLMFVVIAGAELFTGNALIIISVLEKKATWAEMLKNWGIVYGGNLIGSILVAYMLNASFLLHSGNNMFGGMLIRISSVKVGLPFEAAFFSGILCNIIVCGTVWMAYSALDTAGKCLSIFFGISLFATSGYEHCVANMFYIPAAIFAGAVPEYAAASGLSAEALANINWGTFFINNLVPVTLGNIVGGLLFIGVLYWRVYIKK